MSTKNESNYQNEIESEWRFWFCNKKITIKTTFFSETNMNMNLKFDRKSEIERWFWLWILNLFFNKETECVSDTSDCIQKKNKNPRYEKKVE